MGRQRTLGMPYTSNHEYLDPVLEADIARVIGERTNKGTYGAQRSKVKQKSLTARALKMNTATKITAGNKNVWKHVTVDTLPLHAERIWNTYDKDGNGVLDGGEIFLMARDMLAAIPEMSQLYFSDAVSVQEMLADINTYAKTFTYQIFQYADADKNKTIDKDEFL